VSGAAKMCSVCNGHESFYCLNDDGSTRPMCIEKCGEHANPSFNGRCRDCDITHMLDEMQCSGCKRMRYREDDPTGMAWALWGERCACDPRPPSVAGAAP
jgi:hypothetical protein